MVFYEPGVTPHGLPRDPFKSCVVPRPIGWISTLNDDGTANLAPFSQFNHFTGDPPCIFFSANRKADGSKKDSVVNAEREGEFCWAMATYGLREEMNISGEQLRYGEDEFVRAGLEKEKGNIVKAPMVKESPVKFECKYHTTFQLPGDSPTGAADVVVGRVVGIHIEERVLTNGILDIVKLEPIARCGGHKPQRVLLAPTFLCSSTVSDLAQHLGRHGGRGAGASQLSGFFRIERCARDAFKRHTRLVIGVSSSINSPSRPVDVDQRFQLGGSIQSTLYICLRRFASRQHFGISPSFLPCLLFPLPSTSVFRPAGRPFPLEDGAQAGASGSGEQNDRDLMEGLQKLALGAEEEGDKTEGAVERGKEPFALDPVLLAALSHPRDRFLLLRAEVEMEQFVRTPSSTRLPLAPPHFQPALNSYQRLLIHRLADIFGITREVEAAQNTWTGGPAINPSTGQPQGVVVLVKGEKTRIPPAKLASVVPAPEAAPSAVPTPLSTSTSASPVPSPSPSVVSSPAVSVHPATCTTSPPPPPVQPVFKILPRSSASRTASSASSAVGVDDDASTSASASASTRSKSKGRRDLTLEEREAAYKEARERIFKQPDPERPPPVTTASTASPGASELGMGITRPSSAGSTFSRSSAALSISGARPSPSIASESNSSIRSGYTNYYAQPPPPPQHPYAPGYPNLRPSAPVFDPASGGWTYAPQQQEHSYAAQYGGDIYGRTPQQAPSFPATYGAPSPSYALSYAQPPIQVTAPAPQGPSYPYGTSPVSSFHPPPYPPQQPPAASYDPAAWQQPVPRSIPSPSLSTSSSASMHFAPPAPPNAANNGSGYLMRFADGAIVAPGGSVTVPAPGGARSVGSLSSASISSLNSALRTNPSRSGGVQSGSSVLSGRRLSASTTHSLGSMSAISSLPDDSSAPRKSPPASGASSNAAPSEAGSVAGGSSEGKRRDRQTTIVGGRPDADSISGGSEKSKGKQREEVDAKNEQEDPKLHPSLPAKPAWVASQPPPERPYVIQAPPKDKPFEAVPPTQVYHPPPPAAPVPLQHIHQPPPFHGYPVPSSTSVLPPPDLYQQHPPAASSAWGRPVVPSASYAPPPSEFPALGGAYHPSQPPPSLPQPSYPSSPAGPPVWSNPSSHAATGPPPMPYNPSLPLSFQLAAAGVSGGAGAGGGADDLMTLPDMRRPPPRNTQLFDPTKPSVAAGGGVVVGSPVEAVGRAEKLWGLPHHWINSAITAAGPSGAFQRLERGEVEVERFYRDFGRELNDVGKGNEAYRAYCRRVGRDVPPLPKEVKIDGKELWSIMMDPATEPDPIVVEAINRLRASRTLKVAALTNNFAAPGSAPSRHPSSPPFSRPTSVDELRASLKATGQGAEKGKQTYVLKGLFDEFIESCVEGLRKPDPRFFQLALDRLGVKAEETVFLDDIGHNLAAAAKLGIKTIRVHYGRSREATAVLEKLVGVDLGLEQKAKL
ncbi:hypothetical protein JCM8547_008755 [Rhodosporidiobolus lusitaniae]